MSKAFNPEEWVELRTQFEERRDKQLMLMAAHESTSNYGMAYLALWAVLENFAKHLGPAAQRKELKEALTDWLSYLNDNRANKPKEIGSGKFDIPKAEKMNIPAEASLQKLFPLTSGPIFYLALAPKKKYRIRRNDIAHKGEATSSKVYQEFKEVAHKALVEIEAWLSGGRI
jgi:hypothetical protein